MFELRSISVAPGPAAPLRPTAARGPHRRNNHNSHNNNNSNNNNKNKNNKTLPPCHFSVRLSAAAAFGIGAFSFEGVPSKRRRQARNVSSQTSQAARPGAEEATEPRLRVLSLPENLADGCCNSSDELVGKVPVGGKLLWHFRHGESTGNAAKKAARAADKESGSKEHDAHYRADVALADAPLTAKGQEQALVAQQTVAGWQVKPELVVCSPLTRAIQTAATIFEDLLASGATRLVVRPELREVHNDVFENSGRPLAELRACPRLTSLRCWPLVEAAISEAATRDWSQEWDSQWARGSSTVQDSSPGGSGWRVHVADAGRLLAFRKWLSEQSESRIAAVSHWGTINNLLNREPWADRLERTQVRDSWGPDVTWPVGGVARKFNLPNCGWVSAILSQEPALQTPYVTAADIKVTYFWFDNNLDERHYTVDIAGKTYSVVDEGYKGKFSVDKTDYTDTATIDGLEFTPDSINGVHLADLYKSSK